MPTRASAPRPDLEPGPIERVTSDDVVSLATDVGPVPMNVGAVLWLDRCSDPHDVIARLADRIPSVPRLRQRLVRTRAGAGRPVWVDDARFDLAEHVDVAGGVAPRSEEDLLELAAETVTAPLDPERPLWRMRYVPRLERGGAALIVAFHHVLADGIGGLAVLANLVDGDAVVLAAPGFPHPGPDRARLLTDAFRHRWHTVRHPAPALRRLRAAAAALRPHGSRRRAARCSLNRPTGPRRVLTVVSSELDPLHRVARAHGATVNDVLLTAVAGALHDLVASRGEHVEPFVISVPMSARQHTNATSLGNDVGAVPIEVSGCGDPFRRLERTAEVTRAAKATTRGSSMAILGPVFRILARLGVFGWFIAHQRLVHSFVTNLRGPSTRYTFVGATIDSIAAIAVVTGNVTLSFAALSYGGRVAVTVIADPDANPDLPALHRALERRLAELAGA